VATAVLLITSARWPQENGKRFFQLTLMAGVAFAIDLFVWHKSLVLVGAGLGTVLGNTQVFYMALFGLLFFKEKLTLKTGAALVMAVIGVVLMVSIETPKGMTSDNFYFGVICGLGTGIAYALFIFLLRKIELTFPELTSLQKLFWVYLYCSLVLAGVSAATGEIALPTQEDMLWIVLLGVLVNIIGWKLISGNLSNVTAATAGLVLLIQPAGATIWGMLIFDESVSIQQMFGMALLLSAIYISTVKQKRPILPE
jgi:drug/metabolite transporter (DMT)-like permease